MADDSNGLGPMPNFPHQRKRPSKVQKPQPLDPEFTPNPQFHFCAAGADTCTISSVKPRPRLQVHAGDEQGPH